MPQYADNGDDHAYRLLDELVRLALTEQLALTHLSILRQIGLLISKFLAPSSLERPKDIFQKLISEFNQGRKVSDSQIRTIFWIAKALVLQMQFLDEVTGSLLSLLSHESCGLKVAQAFGLLVSPDEVLAKENGARIRPLAKQKIFHICIPKFEEGFRSSDPWSQSNYLIALSGVLKHVPAAVLMQESQTLLPMLLQSLELPDPDVKAATIENLTIISEENAVAVEGHVGSMVARLLKAAVNPSLNAPSVRRNSLRCLHVLPGKIKDSVLLPSRNRVIRDLLAALDDSKRDIRKEAVECRAAWLGMDEPESD